MVSGIPNSAWLFPGTSKKMQCFVTFLNSICTAQVPNCRLSVPLYVFNLMFFIDLCKCCFGTCLNIFYKCTVALNCPHCWCLFCMELLWCCYWLLSLDLLWLLNAYYSRIFSLYLLFPCLPVGLSHFLLLPCVLHSSPLICTPTWSVLFSCSSCISFHRLGIVLVHVFPHSISMVDLGLSVLSDVWVDVFVFAEFLPCWKLSWPVTLLNTMACALCGFHSFGPTQYVLAARGVIATSLGELFDYLIQHVFIAKAMDELLFQLSVTLFVITLRWCYPQSTHPCFSIFPI